MDSNKNDTEMSNEFIEKKKKFNKDYILVIFLYIVIIILFILMFI